MATDSKNDKPGILKRAAKNVGGAIKDIAKDEMYGAFGAFGAKLRQRVDKDSEKIKEAKDTSKKIPAKGEPDASKPMAQYLKLQASSIIAIDAKLEDIVLSQRTIQQDISRILFTIDSLKGMNNKPSEGYQWQPKEKEKDNKGNVLGGLLDLLGNAGGAKMPKAGGALKSLSRVAFNPLTLALGAFGYLAYRTGKERAANPEAAAEFDKKLKGAGERAKVIQGPEHEQSRGPIREPNVIGLTNDEKREWLALPAETKRKFQNNPSEWKKSKQAVSTSPVTPGVQRAPTDTTTGQTTTTEKQLSAAEAQRQGQDVDIKARSYDLESKGPVDFTSDKEITFDSKSGNTIIFKSPHIKFETDHLEFIYKKKSEKEQASAAGATSTASSAGPSTTGSTSSTAPSGTSTTAAPSGTGATSTGATSAGAGSQDIKGGGGKKSVAELVKIAQQGGFTGQDAATAAAISASESGGNPRAHNPNAKTGDNSYGLWQINMLGNLQAERLRQFGISKNEDLFDPVTNAKAAFKLFKTRLGFNHWSDYKNGKYKKFLGTALQALQGGTQQTQTPQSTPDATNAQQAAAQSTALGQQGASTGTSTSTPDASRAQQSAGQSTALGAESTNTLPTPSGETGASRPQQGATQSGSIAPTPGLGEPTKGGQYRNGELPPSALKSIGVGSHKLQPAAADAFKSMYEAAKKDGVIIGVTDSYRTLAGQIDVKRRKPNLAATPGRSNHGWGLALDLVVGGNAGYKNNATYKWLAANASRFGFKGPLQRPFEAWHWEYVGAGATKGQPSAAPGSGTSQPGGSASAGSSASGPSEGTPTPGLGGMGGMPGGLGSLFGMGGMPNMGGKSPLGMMGGMLGGILGGARGGMIGGLAGNLLGGILSSVMNPRSASGSEIDQRSTQRTIDRDKRDRKVGNAQTAAQPPTNLRPNTPQSSLPSGSVHPSPQLMAALTADMGNPSIIRNISEQHSGLGKRSTPSVA